MGGDWVAQAAPLGRSTELRVGTFGDSAPSFLLMERTSLGPGPYPFHRLSVLFYSADCHAYEVLSIDKLSEPGPTTTGDCSGSFPISFHPDGSLSFQYTDWNHERVNVSVDREHLQETRDTPGITGKSEVQFVRSSKAATWGNVQ